MSDTPVDPIGGLTEAAATLHEMFTSYMEVGFTEQQAMQLVSATVAAMISGAGGEQ